MPRTRRSEEDADIDAQIGAHVAALRVELGMSPKELADRVKLSPTHLNALELGKHAFSASLVSRLSRILRVPVAKLLGTESPRGQLEQEWQAHFAKLPTRDQVVLIDLARKLGNWSRDFVVEGARRRRRRPGLLVSLEGIDGVLLRRLASEVEDELEGELPVRSIFYDHSCELWQHLHVRFADPRQSSLERTLLFASERLYRQEAAIRPALNAEAVVLSPFFAMAPSVYQEIEGVDDRRLLDAIATQVLQPDLIVLVRSSPSRAASRATTQPPGEEQFYSPYSSTADFKQALLQYDKAIDEHAARGQLLHVIELSDDSEGFGKHVGALVQIIRGL